MIEEKAEYYNTGYQSAEAKNYREHYTKSRYFFLWQKIVELISKQPQINKQSSILDIGCGPGQFANYMFDQEYKKYNGLDFSYKAIEYAQQANPNYKNNFTCADLYSTQHHKQKYDLVIALETLEHIEGDIEIIKQIPSDTRFIFSVPNFGGQGHVRHFNTAVEILNRYCYILEFEFAYNSIERVDVNKNVSYFICNTIKI